jgi:hypothetical protein
VPEVGEMVTEVTVAVPLLPPPHADSVRIIAKERNKADGVEIFVLADSGSMLTLVVSFLSAL